MYDRVFNCAEQAYFFQKCLNAKDEVRANMIMNSSSAAEQKKISYQIQGINNSDWNKQKLPIMCDILKEKFSQNPDLLHFLKSTGEKELVEGNPRDLFWGAGLSIYNPQIWDKDSRPGENNLGKILVEIREMFK